MTALYQDLTSRNERLAELDVLTSTDAAEYAGTSRVTISAWIKKGRCIGLTQSVRGHRIPLWQFEPAMWPWIQRISDTLKTTDGWAILSYLETPREELEWTTPRNLIEQGHAEKLQLKGA